MNSQQKWFEENSEVDPGIVKNLVSIKDMQEKHAENFAAWLDTLEPITLRTYNFKTLYCHYKGLLK